MQVEKKVLAGAEDMETEDMEDTDAKVREEVLCTEEEATLPVKVDSSLVESTLAAVVQQYGNEDTAVAMEKLQKALGAVKTSNQLNNLLHTLASTTKRGAGRGKIPCHPTTIARRKPDRPRGAAPLSKGRRPNGVTAKAKRPRNLAANVSANVANAKSHK